MQETAPALASPPAAHSIPSLDGLRAVSISLVLLSHLAGTRHFISTAALAPAGDLGNLGVRVFFVISGFLITTLLVAESRRSGTISLPRFYLRRTLRVFPAFYAFVGAVWLMSLGGLVALQHHDLLAALTYTMNFHWRRAHTLGHIWSLSVEEQFYLLWPASILVLGPRRAMWAAAATVCAAPVLRVAAWYLVPAYRDGISEAFFTVADSIAVGCLLAGARPWLDRRARYLRFARSRAFVLVPLAALGANHFAGHALVDFVLLQPLINVAIALVIDRVVRIPDDRAGRLLNARPVAFVGLLSYSLYLWQQIFLDRHSAVPWCAFPQNLALLAAAATLSYFLVEKPALRYRPRGQTLPLDT